MSTLRTLLTRARHLLRGHIENPDSEQGRGRLRLRRAAWSGLSSSVATGSALAAAFISIPLVLGKFGTEKYGVWITISSVLNWLAMADAGLAGTALVNALADTQGRQDHAGARGVVSTAFFSLCAIAVVLGLALLSCFDVIPWRSLFNAPASLGDPELRQAVGLAFCCFLVSFPAGITAAVYTGLQESYIAHAWSAASHIVSLLTLLVVLNFEGGLPSLVLAFSGSRLLVLLIGMTFLFGWHRRDLRPRWRHLSRSAFHRVFNLGWKYLLQQLANIGLFYSQPILLAQMLGPSAVAMYSVAQRLLTLPALLVQFFVVPLMPAYGEARARNDTNWITRTLRRSVLGSALVGSVSATALALTAPWIISWWASPELCPPAGLIWCLAGYAVTNSLASPLAVFLSGMEWIGSLAGVASLNALTTVSLALWWTPLYGISGLGAAMFLALFLTNLLSLSMLTRFCIQSFNRPKGPPL